MLETVALESSDVVAVAELVEQVLEYLPIAHARGGAVDLFKMFLEVLLDGVVVDQRVVNVDKKDHRMAQRHLRFPAPLSASLRPRKAAPADLPFRARRYRCPHRGLQLSRTHPERSSALARICAILPQTPASARSSWPSIRVNRFRPHFLHMT